MLYGKGIYTLGQSLLLGVIAVTVLLPLAAHADNRFTSVKITNRNAARLVRLEGRTSCYYDTKSRKTVTGRVSGSGTRRTFVNLSVILDQKLKDFKRRRGVTGPAVSAKKQQFKDQLSSERELCAGAFTGETPNPTPDPREGPGPTPIPTPGDPGSNPSWNGNLSFGEGAPWSGGPGLRIRWFPVESASGYYVYVLQSNGSVVSKSPILPGGCTQRSASGYTSGLCSIVLSATGYPLGYGVSVSAFNSGGESAPVRLR